MESEQLPPELDYLRKRLKKMTAQYEKISGKVLEQDDNEFLDFHARRLVEMAGNITMGYLLLIDSARNEEFTNSADIFIKYGEAENQQRADYISNSEIKDLGVFRYV